MALHFQTSTYVLGSKYPRLLRFLTHKEMQTFNWQAQKQIHFLLAEIMSEDFFKLHSFEISDL